MDYKPYSPEWHRKRYLKEALDKYFDDYVDNEVIHGDLMDILSVRMSAAVNEVNKVLDLKDKLKTLDGKFIVKYNITLMSDNGRKFKLESSAPVRKPIREKRGKTTGYIRNP